MGGSPFRALTHALSTDLVVLSERTKPCLHCGKPFVPREGRRLTCSDACRKAYIADWPFEIDQTPTSVDPPRLRLAGPAASVESAEETLPASLPLDAPATSRRGPRHHVARRAEKPPPRGRDCLRVVRGSRSRRAGRETSVRCMRAEGPRAGKGVM